jgi:hypothetical protein
MDRRHSSFIVEFILELPLFGGRLAFQPQPQHVADTNTPGFHSNEAVVHSLQQAAQEQTP